MGVDLTRQSIHFSSSAALTSTPARTPLLWTPIALVAFLTSIVSSDSIRTDCAVPAHIVKADPHLERVLGNHQARDFVPTTIHLPPRDTHAIQQSANKMFFVKNMDREVTIHPSYFNSDASRIVLDRLRSDIEGTIEGTLMVIRIVDVEDISEPKLQPGTGMAVYHLHYRAIVWRPFRGEVVDGLVSSVVNNGFFVDVGALSVFVSKAMIPTSLKYSVEGSTPQFTDNVDQSVERGTQVRLRIKGIRGEMGSMYAIGSIREDYLGPLLQ